MSPVRLAFAFCLAVSTNQTTHASLVTWTYDSGPAIGPAAGSRVIGSVTFDTNFIILGGTSSPSTSNGGIVAWTFTNPILPQVDTFPSNPAPLTFTDVPFLADGSPGASPFGVRLVIPQIGGSNPSIVLGSTSRTFVNGAITTTIGGEFSANPAFDGTFELAAVPEPASLASAICLGASGLVAGIGRRRKKSQPT